MRLSWANFFFHLPPRRPTPAFGSERDRLTVTPHVAHTDEERGSGGLEIDEAVDAGREPERGGARTHTGEERRRILPVISPPRPVNFAATHKILLPGCCSTMLTTAPTTLRRATAAAAAARRAAGPAAARALSATAAAAEAPKKSEAAAAPMDAFWMPFTANQAFKQSPRMLTKSKGMYYWTADGRKILDGTAGLWCVACTAGGIGGRVG